MIAFKRIAETATRQIQLPIIGPLLQSIAYSANVLHFVAMTYERHVHILESKEIFRHTSFQVPSAGKCTSLPQCRELGDSGRIYQIIPVEHHFRKTLLKTSSRASLSVVTIFPLKYCAGQRVLLICKTPLRSTTIALAKIDVSSNACYPHVNRGTVSFLTTFYSALIRKRENIKRD